MRTDHRRRMRFAVLPLLLTLLSVAACDSTDPGDGNGGPATTGVFVANQGSFTDANGSVTHYDPRTEETSLYLGGVGSTIQSLFIHDQTLYVLANSANRIDAVSLQGGGQTSIPVLSPRYMDLVNDSTAYVTSLFGSPASFSGGNVFEIDLSRNVVVDSIEVGDNPEGIVVLDTLAFVANNAFGAGRTVSVIQTERREIVATLDVDCDGPRFVLADDEPQVWVLCTGQTIYDGEGNVVDQTDGAIRIIDPLELEVVERIDLDDQILTVGPGQDASLSPGLQQIFVVVGGNRVLRFDTRSNDQIDEFGPLQGNPIGAIALDPVEERLYVGRVAGFTEAGTVTIHDLQGEEIGSFGVGVAPTYIAFRP